MPGPPGGKKTGPVKVKTHEEWSEYSIDANSFFYPLIIRHVSSFFLLLFLLNFFFLLSLPRTDPAGPGNLSPLRFGHDAETGPWDDAPKMAVLAARKRGS